MNESPEKRDLPGGEDVGVEAVGDGGVVVNVDVGIEEVVPTPKKKRKAVAGFNNGAQPTAVDINKYRYKLIHQDSSNYKYKLVTDGNEAGDEAINEVYSLKTSFEDGHFHPEEAPTYSDLFQRGKEVIIEVDFNDQFGNKVEQDSGGTREASPRIDRVDTSPAQEDVGNLPMEHRGAVHHHVDRTPVVVKQLPPRPPRPYPGQTTPPSNLPIYNYSPPSVNPVQGHLYPPPHVKSLSAPSHKSHGAPHIKSLSPYPPYRSKLEDYSYPGHSPYKRHIDHYSGYLAETPVPPPLSTFLDEPPNQPPLASFVIARLNNETVPTYPIPHNLVDNQERDKNHDNRIVDNEVALSSSVEVTRSYDGKRPFIPRPPGTPSPTTRSVARRGTVLPRVEGTVVPRPPGTPRPAASLRSLGGPHDSVQSGSFARYLAY